MHVWIYTLQHHFEVFLSLQIHSMNNEKKMSSEITKLQ